MSFYNRYTAKYEADPTWTPFGLAKATVLLLEDCPIFRVYGEQTDRDVPLWIAYMVRSDFASDELMPITLNYANNKGGIFHDVDSRGWYCFIDNSIEAAYLAWDFTPFLERVNWTRGIAVVQESTDPDWIATRRSWCEDMLQKHDPQYLKSFYAQFKQESQDQPI